MYCSPNKSQFAYSSTKIPRGGAGLVSTAKRLNRIFIQKNYFDEETVAIRYRKDQLDPREWCLIYYEPLFEALNYIGIGVICLISFVSLSELRDYQKNGRFTSPSTIRVRQDFEQLGIFRYFFLFVICCVAAISLRFLSLRLSKIYINRKNSNQMLVCASRFIVFRRWVINKFIF